MLLFSGSVLAEEGIQSLTRPSQDAELSFVTPGLIAEIPVAEGDLVVKGQLLLRQNDDAEQLQLAQLKAQADDETLIEARQAQLDQEKVNFEQIKMIYLKGQGAVTEFEYRQADLKVLIAKIQLRLSKFERRQNGRKYEQAKAQFDRMRIKSPIDGKVEQIVGYLEVGESVDGLQPVVRVVNINPLRVDVSAPIAIARSLKAGEPAWITFEGDGGGVVQGKIIFVSSVAEADTLRVEVEVPNDAGRPAGEYVPVSFEKPE